MANLYDELHNPKAVRLEQDADNACRECDQLKDSLIRAQSDIRMVRNRADRYYKMLQTLAGKAAILRHENNKLRRKLYRKESE